MFSLMDLLLPASVRTSSSFSSYSWLLPLYQGVTLQSGPILLPSMPEVFRSAHLTFSDIFIPVKNDFFAPVLTLRFQPTPRSIIGLLCQHVIWFIHTMDCDAIRSRRAILSRHLFSPILSIMDVQLNWLRTAAFWANLACSLLTVCIKSCYVKKALPPEA